MRKLPLALACALILGTPSAFAIGLGELQAQSYLNQPLRATIPITDVRPGDLEVLGVKLGDEAQFARHGYSLMSIYGRIKLQIVAGQHPHILLTSDTPVRDPALGLVLEVEGPSGTLERSVSILLDPEGYRPVALIKPASVPAIAQGTGAGQRVASYSAQEASARRAPVQAVPMPDGGDYTAVSGDTAYGIARRVKPAGVDLQQTLDMILQSNPHAFANPNDASTLLAGKTLKIPNAQVMRDAKGAQATSKTTPPPQGKAAFEQQPPVAPVVQEPRLDIVQPTAPAGGSSTPVVAAPVVGEVVSGAVGVSGAASAVADATQAPAIPVEVQEQIEATKVENERLTGLLASQDERLQKMEELLRLNESLIKDMEQKMSAAPAAPAVPVAAPVEAAAPWWSSWLIGLGGLIAALLAYFAGSRRRAKDEPKPVAAQPAAVVLAKTEEAVVSEPAVVSPKAAPAVAAAVAGAATADVIENAADPVKAALEEADVMQAYGLHDRAIQVLSDALQEQPGNASLLARRARAMHEAGDGEGFLREAEAFRGQHPMDEANWAEISALGRAHYASSPLFAAGAAAEVSPWAQPSPAPTQGSNQDVSSDLIQPLDELDLGAPMAAVAQPVAMDMPPLDMELPSVSELSASKDAGVYSLDGGGDGNIADLVDDWAPLELPLSADVQPVAEKDASGLGGAHAPVTHSADESGISAEDLATLGIDWADDDTPAPVTAELPMPEFDFADDRKALEQASVAPSSLEPEFVPLPLDDLAQEPSSAVVDTSLAALEPLDLPSLDLDLGLDIALAPSSEPASLDEAVHELEPLSLDMYTSTAETKAPVVAPMELSLDDALVIPSPVVAEQDADTASAVAGMVSEQEVKIDIASAYLDMGDLQGAREMLQEVLGSDCDELLKDRAQKMLNQMA